MSVLELPEDVGFAMLTEKITRDTTFRCASYKDKCLRRRIAVRMRATGVTSYDAYARVLDSDASEYPRLLDALTINVTKFFRNWTTFEAIARDVVPALWAKPGPIRIWSAGSSSGEEVYSLAALMHAHAESLGESAWLADRVEILGTDIDRGCLAAAERAMYAAPAFADTPEEWANTYFPRVGEWRTVRRELRDLVTFERRDLLNEPAPAGQFDLVVCRNVIIYFGRDAQDELLAKFHGAMVSRGFLVLGRVETLLGTPRMLFTPIDLRERVFRRTA